MPASVKARTRSLHLLGVLSGFSAGVWMGAAEAPTKFVAAGFSPTLLSLAMVSGVFVGRWTIPTLLKGTGYVFHDLGEKKHLIIWALLGGALWAVANTLGTVAVRDVGLAIAFPLWNTDALVGLLWGWLFFYELRGAGVSVLMKVLGGTAAILVGAIILAYASFLRGAASGHHSWSGILVAIGAAVLWHNVLALSKSIHQRHESAFVRNGVHYRRTCHDDYPGAGFRGRSPGAGAQNRAGAARLVLDVPRRVLLGGGRSVCTVCSKICGNWTRGPSYEHQSDLGAGLGGTGLRRIRREGH